MLRLYSSRFGWMFLILGLWSVAAQADQIRQDDHRHRHDEQFRYRYVSLDELLPPGFLFFDPIAIDERGRVFGTALDTDFTSHIAVYADDALTVVQHGMAAAASAANNRGTVGGIALVDPENQLQAALFRGDQVELVPQQLNEIESQVIALNDRGTALVKSLDTSFSTKYYLYREGQSTLLEFVDFGPGNFEPIAINNRGIIAGNVRDELNRVTHAFRFDSYTGELSLFNSLPSDSKLLATGINRRGDVLGYSYNSPGSENVGVWDRNGKFRIFFAEGNSAFPTISNSLVFNDKGLIVITRIAKPLDEKDKSYLVPRPGVRLNLTNLVENLPAQRQPNYIVDINNRGSMIGNSNVNFNVQDNFLLERIKHRDH